LITAESTVDSRCWWGTMCSRTRAPRGMARATEHHVTVRIFDRHL
jgi:hypothetical protein